MVPSDQLRSACYLSPDGLLGISEGPHPGMPTLLSWLHRSPVAFRLLHEYIQLLTAHTCNTLPCPEEESCVHIMG